MRKFLTFLVLCLLWSCQTKPFENIEATYEDGSPKLVKTYRSEAKKVLLKETSYYPGQQVKMKGTYKNNLRDGIWSYWYASGNLWSRGTYKDGIEKGLKTVWHENGQKYYEGYTDNGIRQGFWKFWEEDGRLIKQINYDE